MKKLTIALAVITFLVAYPAFSFARENKQMHKSTMGPGMMMGKQMVASDDGGVIVMVGNKLLKYDRDLNLKKEVEIKLNPEAMQKMMMQMKESCPKQKMVMPEEDTKE
ncbi:MAG: hypothetical protein JW714_03515 [Candidatus Omnitrophica bacterium]|nr:hypothetical protein [Candidatus Omnitrophota bacterium]